jgi:hypothetical protein
MKINREKLNENQKKKKEQERNIKQFTKEKNDLERKAYHLHFIEKEGSVMVKNFNSLIVNMSRYLFEPPHSEETNFFSSTHHMFEKSFLLFLAMFISNQNLEERKS